MNQERVLTSSQLISIEKVVYHFFKRLFDIIVGLIGIIMLIPLTIIIKIVSLVNKDTNSIFYKQKRIGKDGKFIYMYKFRTMVPDADKKLKEILKDEKYKKEWEENQKLSNDPRITKVGKVLRETSLDEIPQFINVLKGDMSLIGPRPLVEGELDAHKGNHEIYESVRPGITSWWAANGRSCTSYKKRLELEDYYIKNMGFKLDLKCMIKTILVVFKKDGAK
ncbi:MAG: sugar transferase [Firmicutes bacterium]|nr:sugar transferase [Bacillota bacterium]